VGFTVLRKKSLLPVDSGPQRLKPDLLSINYVRPKGRTLQKLGRNPGLKSETWATHLAFVRANKSRALNSVFSQR
jgi:hypothetical protein